MCVPTAAASMLTPWMECRMKESDVVISKLPRDRMSWCASFRKPVCHIRILSSSFRTSQTASELSNAASEPVQKETWLHRTTDELWDAQLSPSFDGQSKLKQLSLPYRTSELSQAASEPIYVLCTVCTSRTHCMSSALHASSLLSLTGTPTDQKAVRTAGNKWGR